VSSLVKDLIEAGIHFGQRRSNWNPKMKPYIFGLRNKIHIIDIRHTVRGLLLARKFIQQTVADGKDVCFVGTKRQARAAVEKHAIEVGMPWVTERWVGGTLKKITRNLQGIRDMEKHPGCLVIIDVNREVNALREARSLGIPTIALIDTDGDPDLVDIPIPGNDDSMRSIDVIVRELCVAVSLGKTGRGGETETPEPEVTTQADQRRSTRTMFRADDATSTATGSDTPDEPDTPAVATSTDAASS